jgi:hypothetical protein
MASAFAANDSAKVSTSIASINSVCTLPHETPGG